METATAKEDEPCAYAKLWGQLEGKPFHTYVTALPSTLGRGSTATEGDRKPVGFIDLGRSKALSREHGEGEDGVGSFSNFRWICRVIYPNSYNYMGRCGQSPHET